MLIDEFLIALGVKADTKGLDDAKKGLEGVEGQAKKTDSKLAATSKNLNGFIKGFAVFSTVATAAIKSVVVGAWAYLDSTIDKIESLQNSEDASLRTTKEQVEMSKKYRENMEKMGKAIEGVKTRVALAFLPTMYELSSQYGRLLDDNKELIENGINKLLSVVSSASQVLTNFIRFIDKVVEGTVGWKNAMLILVGVLALVKRATILAFIANPIVWVGAAIAGLLLLIDDLMTYLDGGESEFSKFWGAMITWINKVKDAWNGFSNTAKGGFKTLAIGLALLAPMFGGLAGTVKALASTFLLVGKAMAMTPIGRVITLVSALVFVIIDLIKWLNGGESLFSSFWQAGANAWNKLVSGAKNTIDSIKNFFGAGIDWIVDKFSKLPSMLGSIASGLTFGLSDKIGSAVSRTSNRVVNNTSTTNASFNVNGSVSPTATANVINANLNSIAQSNISGGVAAL